ncbi:MAG: hypothetical protein J7L54_01290 [Elusimicrobia bacterium]|nr:hypothetical protein [Elusimicrobiota bacterium]
MKDEKLKSKKGEKNPLLNLPPGRGEKERGDFPLSTCLPADVDICFWPAGDLNFELKKRYEDKKTF